ncbi:MAG: 3'-5' exonuclease [Candidatus Arcticimaribacter sp.]
MINYRDIIVFDFETTGRNPHKCQPTQIAAVAIHARKLELQPNGIFESKIKCITNDEKAIAAGFDPIEEGALEKTRRTRASLREGPMPKTVWKNFAKFCDQFNFKKTPWYAPIPAGFNISSFDMTIVQRLCEEHGPTSDKTGEQTVFHPIFKMDLMQHIYCWFENYSDVNKFNMDYLRDFFGMPNENAHDALQDVKDTANILIRFLKFQRSIIDNNKVQFKNAFANGNYYV